MFPFIFAFILAIGIPFLPSSFHRALHLPSLRFNFLSASYAPERTFVSSSENPLLLEDSYSRGGSDSGESSQYLVFPHVSTPSYSDHEADSDVLAYMSFTEKLELNYPQASIWLIICAQLLYQLVEATILMTLSFLFAATFLSRASLSTLIERFCTALFICWHYSPKVALSSFLQDIFLWIHRYWMDNSVTGQFTNTPTSTATISEGLDPIALKEANCWSENSSSVALITPPRSRETSVPAELALIPPLNPLTASENGTQLLPTSEPSVNVCSHIFGSITEHSQHEPSPNAFRTPVESHLLRPTSSSVVTRATNYPSTNASNSKADLSGTDEVAVSLNHTSAPSFATMQDLYKPSSTPNALSAPPCEAKAPEAIVGSSLSHDSIADINSSTSKPEPDESQDEGLLPSSSEISYSGRRRYKSDGIQVRSARCHLGDSAAPPDPAKVNETCAFWKSAVQHDEKAGGVFENQVLAPGFENSSLECTSKLQPNRAVATGSVGSVDALAGIVLTPEGEMMVPASQRADGSMRKEIKVRSGHFLREPLAEKYRPPAARVRTSTWDPRLGENFATPPSSPHVRNSLLPFTPVSVHQRFFGRQCNSPASQSNNWRRSTPRGKENDPFTPPPPPLEKLPAPEFSTPSQTEAMASLVSVRALAPVDNQSSLVQPGDQRSSELVCAEKVTITVPDAEQAESSKPVCAAAKVWDKATSAASFEASRLPLRDITTSFAPEAVDRLNPPSTPTVLASTIARAFASLQIAKVIQRDFEAPSRTSATVSRETFLPSPNRKRKSSGEPNTPCAVKSPMLSPSESPTPVPHRRPRTRRSAPHLGKSPGNRRQVKTQTPEGSAKRRRMRTTSALGVENVAAAVAAAATAVDRNGQIVLPAGTGWKGRSLTTSQLPVAQRQRQLTLALDATT